MVNGFPQHQEKNRLLRRIFMAIGNQINIMMGAKTTRRIAYCAFLFFFTLIAAEIILRIYNPFPSSVIGDKIILTPNYRKVYNNNVFKADMDEKIIYQRNKIGLRGPDPPGNFKDHLTIIAVGGSTTECMYISEGKTWEDQLAARLKTVFPSTWINNAGFAGHSTFGHIILLRDYITALRPNVCLFLVGINDVHRFDLRPHDTNFTKTDSRWILTLAKKSALMNAILNIYRNRMAREKNITDNISFNLRNKTPLVLPETGIDDAIKKEEGLLKDYRMRLGEMIGLCKANNIEPIFITQPSLMGEQIDTLTGVDLATYPVSPTVNGKLFWKYLELYNSETKKVANDSGLFLIDLANELPKTSRFFYDAIHFNNTGSAKVGEIVAGKLVPYFRVKYGNTTPAH
jgi:lysophospholipase L1-like esterase